MEIPRWALCVLLAWAVGATQDPEPPVTRCVCKPTMTLELSPGGHGTCNNATFDWLLQTAMGKVSAQSDEIDSLKLKVQNMETSLADKENMLVESRVANEELRVNVEKFQNQLFIIGNQLSEQQVAWQQEMAHLDSCRVKSEQTYEQLNKLVAREAELLTINAELRREIEELTVHQAKRQARAKDCADIQHFGYRYSGIYTIYPQGSPPEGIDVFCDLNTEHGGWTVLMRRQDGSESFEQNWSEYKRGFGKNAKEFWIGNEYMHMISQQRHYEVRIDLTDFDGRQAYATYDSFVVGDEQGRYKLHLGAYGGNAGDSLGHHSNQPFSTRDLDNDLSRSGHCSQLFGGGGWWFVRCYDSNLCGRYTPTQTDERDGIIWWHWDQKHKLLRHADMKIRPVGFTD